MEEIIKRACERLKVSSPKAFQIEAISALLLGKDVFLSYPTGSGKSLVFQALPFAKDYHSQCEGSCVLVIQPIIALMLDHLRGGLRGRESIGPLKGL